MDGQTSHSLSLEIFVFLQLKNKHMNTCSSYLREPINPLYTLLAAVSYIAREYHHY